MNSNKEHITIVWLKRDLRLQDNEAITNALALNKPVLLLYVFENSLENDLHYSRRHWNFIKQSIQDLNQQLEEHNSKVLSVKGEVINTFNKLLSTYKITDVFSHQETGIQITYDRDKSFKRFCRNNLIEWHENINNGVYRGLQNREDWVEKWEQYMQQTQLKFNPIKNQLISLSKIGEISSLFILADLKTNNESLFQKGGTTTSLKYINTFFNERYKNYMSNISKPLLARKGCSRISPYIAWGNVSIRQVWQKAKMVRKNSTRKRELDAFTSRLRWQAHFIQKFEMEHTMEKASLNKGYRKLKKDISEAYQIAWKNGQTGYPLIDACMRCLNETGYLNFRMRALVVSFFTHNLWQPWQEATRHLSQMFLDFEPGIHFPQLQMQAGETGINMLRIYNPIKNSLEHDSNAIFIKKWVPELAALETPFAHQPYLMTVMEQSLHNFKLGENYPNPIVDLQITRKKASDILWNMQKDSDVKSDNIRILKKHVIHRKKS